jgi:hypothetical protein
MDDSGEFVGLVAVLSGELDEFSGSRDHGGLFGRAGNGDASAAAKLGLGLAVCDCAADFSSYLLVQRGRILSVDLDTLHGAIHNSAIGVIVL